MRRSMLVNIRERKINRHGASPFVALATSPTKENFGLRGTFSAFAQLPLLAYNYFRRHSIDFESAIDGIMDDSGFHDQHQSGNPLALFQKRNEIHDNIRETDVQAQKVEEQRRMLNQQREVLDDEHRDLERRLREVQDRQRGLDKEEEALNKQRDQNTQHKKRLWSEAFANEQDIKNVVTSDPVFKMVYEYGLEEGKKGRY